MLPPEQVRRVVNFFDGATPEDLLRTTVQPTDRVAGGITFLRVGLILACFPHRSNRTQLKQDSRPRDPTLVPNGQEGQTFAATTGQIIILYDRFFQSSAGVGTLPSQEADLHDPAVLDRAMQTQSATMFHELLHRVSHGQMRAVLDRARLAGARIQRSDFAAHIRIDDVRMIDFQSVTPVFVSRACVLVP